MSRNNGYLGPKLPRTLLDQIPNVGGATRRRNEASRKDRPKDERRQQKQAFRVSKPLRRPAVRSKHTYQPSEGSSSEDEAAVASRPASKDAPKPVKSILKKIKEPQLASSDDAVSFEQVEEDDEESDEEDDGDDGESAGLFAISRQAAKAGLADEDAEIVALERKLGVKGKTSKASRDDDLDWLLAGSDSDVDLQGAGVKRKRPEDAKWLRDKRLKSSGAATPTYMDDADEVPSEIGGLSESSQDDESDDKRTDLSLGEDEDGFAGFDSAEDSTDKDEAAVVPSPPRRQRENPYIAPVATQDQPATKYVPPALRQPASSDAEALKRLHRQMQGQLNRLSEANLLSILHAVEEFYVTNARQHVTATLVEMLVGLAADQLALNDTFLILHAGFAAALYKTVGTDFGTQLVETIVKTYEDFSGKSAAAAKQCLNLLSFLGHLYAFQVISSGLIFDYVRLLLTEMTEINTELLLRIVRTSGTQLRHDDPSSLKDIVLRLQRNVADTGEANLSVRTKYMLETIQNLKNNRMKTGAAGATLVAEHITTMRKTLGSLNNTHSIKATEPLRFKLSDVRDAEQTSKWWLVGASYHDPAKSTTISTSVPIGSGAVKRFHDDDAAYDSETPGHVNLHRLARQQGMNTDIRRAVFIAIMSASDYKDAHVRLLKLRLKAKQELEVPRVLLQCVLAESGRAYNPYYALVARKLCKGEKKAGKAFQFQFWDVLKRLEGTERGGAREQDGARELDIKEAVAVAKLYAALIADHSLSIAVLKKIDFGFLQLAEKLRVFTEVLLTTVFMQIWAASKRDQNGLERAVDAVFARANEAPGMIEGLQQFLKSTVRKAALANRPQEAEVVEIGCDAAMQALSQASKTGPYGGDDSESE